MDILQADTVVVWLGKRYSEYQHLNKDQTDQEIDPDRDDSQKSATTIEAGESPITLSPDLDKRTNREPSGGEREMVTRLCADGYWNRLWIIQEIGRARQIKVCFGNLAMGWNDFIDMATLHNRNCDGPLRLNRLLQEKYSGGHTLRKLLQDHREAMCKEPRDKIYGLVGLAIDTIGFPMDYMKSLIEIWRDTMEFMNCRGLLPESDIIPFGRLVKSLLIGADIGPFEQTLQLCDPRSSSAPTLEDPSSHRVFQLKAYVVGCIMATGPSTAEVVSSLRKADEWTAKLQETFKEELGDAHRENDTLMRAILTSDETRLSSICFSRVSNVRWEAFGSSNSKVIGDYESMIKERNFKNRANLQPRTKEHNDDTSLGVTGNSNLFLVKKRDRQQTPWKMGITSRLSQPGDLICWINGVKRALILRVTFPERVLRVFGTAFFTRDFHKNSQAPDISRLSSNEILPLKLDAATIYILLD